MEDFLMWWNSHGWWMHAGVILGVELLMGAFLGVLESCGRRAMRESAAGGAILVFARITEMVVRLFCVVGFVYLFFSGVWALWLTIAGVFS